MPRDSAAVARTRLQFLHRGLPNPSSNASRLKRILASHFLKIRILEECNGIKSRRVFNETPHRVARALSSGKILHAQSLKCGVASLPQLGNAIVQLYANCGDVNFTEKTFNLLETRDVVSWNSLLSLYSRCDWLEMAIQTYQNMGLSGIRPNHFTFAIVLSACGRSINAEFGRQIHCTILKMGYVSHLFCQGSLIDMYAKCNFIRDARRVFDRAVGILDTVSWTSMIAGYVLSGLPEEALIIFEEMRKAGHKPDQVTYVTVINAFVRIGNLDDARYWFSQLPKPNVVAWNAMISAHVQTGFELESINYFLFMMRTGLRPNQTTLISILSAIANVEALDHGKAVHSLSVKQGLSFNTQVVTSLINMYAKSERIGNAKQVFEDAHEWNVTTFNAMLGCYAQNGYAYEAFKLFSFMRSCDSQPDDITYISILKSCVWLALGSQLHSFIIKNSMDLVLFVGNALVDMYAKCGALNEARRQFEHQLNRDVVSWNTIIVGFVQGNEENGAFSMFKRMIVNGYAPDEVSLSSILSACANVRALHEGKQFHCYSLKCGLDNGHYVGSSLVDMYTKCGIKVSALEVLHRMQKRSASPINSLIAGCAPNNLEEAIDLFHGMQDEGLSPSAVTFAGLLESCGGRLNVGKQIHCIILKRGILSNNVDFLGVSLLLLYLNSLNTSDAEILFSEFPNPKTTVSWTAMISGYAQNGFGEDALVSYQEMRSCSDAPLDEATFVSVLKACAVIASLRDGEEVHALIFRTGHDSDEVIGSALVDMYAKCGDTKSSSKVFNEMGSRDDVISWNSMISGFAKNGDADNALKAFYEMDVRPDKATFLGVLAACSHAGRISEGLRIFDAMVSNYKMNPGVEIIGCMADLLGRRGFVKEAEEFIEGLEFEPNAIILSALLGSCAKHGDDARGRRVGMKLMELEPQNSSGYVEVSNFQAASGEWDGVKSLRKAMKEMGVKKFPGCSWIKSEHQTHLFFSGDDSHSRSEEISFVKF